jgi:hypothetical protein
VLLDAADVQEVLLLQVLVVVLDLLELGEHIIQE